MPFILSQHSIVDLSAGIPLTEEHLNPSYLVETSISDHFYHHQHVVPVGHDRTKQARGVPKTAAKNNEHSHRGARPH